jgi:hypothetical protein
MNKELAEELKAAGFPQELKLGSMFYASLDGLLETACNEYGYECECEGWRNPITGYTKAPTLSDLIEACGDSFILLCHNPFRNEWIAGDTVPPKEAKHFGEGSTPEEAVAKLWLALNKK